MIAIDQIRRILNYRNRDIAKILAKEFHKSSPVLIKSFIQTHI